AAVVVGPRGSRHLCKTSCSTGDQHAHLGTACISRDRGKPRIRGGLSDEGSRPDQSHGECPDDPDRPVDRVVPVCTAGRAPGLDTGDRYSDYVIVDQVQYTSMYRPSHTTSTKCQYQAAPSKPKWCSGVKSPRIKRYRITVSIEAPMITWNP